jgi:hypothetical protein
MVLLNLRNIPLSSDVLFILLKPYYPEGAYEVDE